tara:strand:+ start:4961 stop:5356 length:396 start_codon:yes stop_codon:yes gene_type:complete
MATQIQRAWYIDKLKRIGIVEKGNSPVTKDGYSSNWQSISEIKDLRIYAISRDANLAAGTTLTDVAFAQIPEQFHEILVSKVIAMGYKDPRHLDLKLAQYFDMEYNLGIKEARKFSKSNYQTIGSISPQSF